MSGVNGAMSVYGQAAYRKIFCRKHGNNIQRCGLADRIRKKI